MVLWKMYRNLFYAFSNHFISSQIWSDVYVFNIETKSSIRKGRVYLKLVERPIPGETVSVSFLPNVIISPSVTLMRFSTNQKRNVPSVEWVPYSEFI